MRFTAFCAAMTAAVLMLGCAEEVEPVAAPEPAEPAATAPAPEADLSQYALEVDPICDMSLKEHAVAATHEYDGETYGFCSEYCRDKFAEDPAGTLAKAQAGEAEGMPET